MVIRYQKSNLFCVPQARHARLAGELAQHYAVGLLKGPEMIEQVLHALFHHDDCWKVSDLQLHINPDTEKPFDFNNFPTLPKLEMYRSGIEELVKHSTYAGLLTSLHFSWFYKDDKTPEGKAFYLSEKKRQTELKSRIEPKKLTSLEHHFRFLQFFDNLSLYLCLNQPGVSKENEFEWFKKGFPYSDMLTEYQQQIMARWSSLQSVSISPFPFAEPFSIEFDYYVLTNSPNLNQAWKNRKMHTNSINFSD